MNQIINYNLKQLEVVESTEPKLVVEAPPGSGKTATLIGAITEYAKQNPMAKITAITFTRKAAAELQSRIAIYNAEISTIHSWSYRRLQEFAAKYNFVIDLLTDDMIKEILVRICRTKNRLYVNQFQLFSYVMGNFNIDIDEKLKYLYESIRKVYVDFKQRNNLYDFTDLPKYLFDVMETYNEYIYDIDGFFVDEFQDVDEIEVEIFKKVMAAKKMYIGDVNQSIYLFRGAVRDIFNQLPDFTKYVLDTNYRSYQEIIDFATEINKRVDDILYLQNSESTILGIMEEYDAAATSGIICERGIGGNVYGGFTFDEAYDMFKEQSESMSSIIKSLLNDRNTQILCRYNKEVKKIKSYGLENVSTVHQAKGLEYSNVVLVDFNIDDQEEQNIAYVGMTRAKNNLLIIDFSFLCYWICKLDIKPANKLF